MVRWASGLSSRGSEAAAALLEAAEADRARAQAEYEVALRFQAGGEHERAAELLPRLLESLPRKPARAARGRRDEAWLQRLRYLCLRNLAVSRAALGQHAEAFEAAREAQRLASAARPSGPRGPRGGTVGEAGADEDGSLWRLLAESAASCGRWGDARLAFERCACLWPGDAPVLRGLARALLMLGDLRACRVALEALREADGAGLQPREAWLLQHLRLPRGKRERAGASGGASEDAAQHDFEQLAAERSKRLRLDVAPEAPEAVRLAVEEPSLWCLLKAARSAAEGNLPPSMPVVFELGAGAPALQARDGDGPHPHREVELACGALWEAFRPLLAHPWPEGQDAPQFVLAALRSDTEAASESEAALVSRLLGAEAGKGAGARAPSPRKPWREWLRSVVCFALDHFALVRGRRGALRLARALVDLAVWLVVLSAPGQRSEALCRGAPAHGWLTPKLHAWLSAPPRPGEAEGGARLATRRLVGARGLDLAEACALLGARDPPFVAAAAEFLRAWRAAADGLPQQILAWLRYGDPPAGAAAAAASAGLEASAVVVRYLWLAASLEAGGAARALLQQCQQAAEARERAGYEAEVQRFAGAPVSASRCLERLDALASERGEAGEAPARAALDLQDAICQAECALWPPDGAEPPEAGDSDALRELAALAGSFVESLRPASGAPAEAPPAAPGASGTALRLLCALAALLGRAAAAPAVPVGFSDGGLALLVPVLRRAGDLLDALSCRTCPAAAGRRGPAPAGGGPAPGGALLLLRGIAPEAISPPYEKPPAPAGAPSGAAPGAGPALFLAPPVERLGLAALLLAARLGRAEGPERLCAAHGALALGARAVGALLLAAGTTPALRGGLLLVEAVPPGPPQGAAAASAAASAAALWPCVGGFLEAAHDLGLLLPELAGTGGCGARAQLASSWARELFQAPPGEPERESPLSLASTLIACGLRANSPTVAAWRAGAQRWASAAAAHALVAAAAPAAKVVLDIDRDDDDVGGECEDAHAPAPQPADGVSRPRVGSPHAAACRQALLNLREPDWCCPLPGFCGAVGRGSAGERSAAELDDAVCRLLARGLACLCLLPGVDPEPPRPIAARSAEQLQRLSSPWAYSGPEGVDAAEAPAPHLLSLALAVHQSLLAVGAQGSTPSGPRPVRPALLQGVLARLDSWLFPGDSLPGHPVLLPEELVEMAQDLRRTRNGPAFCGSTPAASHEAVKLARDALQGLEWPARQHTGAATATPEAAEGPDHFVERGRVAALQLAASCVDVGPAMEVPPMPPLDAAYALALADMSPRKADLADCMKLLSTAAKDAACRRADRETWARAAVAFRRLFFAQDEKQAGDDDLTERLRCWGRGRQGPVVWGGRLRWLYGQARVLSLMLEAHCEQELTAELGRLAELSATGSPTASRCGPIEESLGRCRDLANQWLARQLDLLSLYRARWQSLALEPFRERGRAPGEPARDSEEKQLWLRGRSEDAAQKVTWLLASCTDLAERMPRTRALLARRGGSWALPAFAAPWAAASAAGCSPLLVYGSADDDGCRPPPYLWYAPYAVARGQWSLLASGRGGAAAGGHRDPLLPADILGLLRDACDVESWAAQGGLCPRAQLAAGASVELHGLSRAPELNGREGVVEYRVEATPRWRVRLKSGERLNVPAESLRVRPAAPGAAASGESRAEPASLRHFPTRVPLPRPRAAVEGVGDAMEREPLWRLQVLRLRVARDLPGGAAASRDTPEQASREAVVAAAFGAMEKVVEERSTYGCLLHLERARHAEVEGRLADAAGGIMKVITVPNTFPEKGYIGLLVMPHVELNSSVGDVPYPWEQHVLARRKYNSMRCRLIAYALRLHELALRQVLPAGASLEAPPEAPATPLGPVQELKPCSVSAQTVSEVAAALGGLAEGRPAAWEALRTTTGNLVVLARGTKPQADGQTSKFWAAARAVAIETLRRTFGVLLREGAGPGAPRPCLDWELLVMLRSACVGVHGIGYLDDARRLCDLYAQAAGQLRSFAHRAAAARSQGTAEGRVDTRLTAAVCSAEGLFQTLCRKGMAPARQEKARWGSADEPWLTSHGGAGALVAALAAGGGRVGAAAALVRPRSAGAPAQPVVTVDD